MAVLNYREVLPRTFSHRFGEAPTAERRFVVTVDEPSPTQDIINAIGVFHGSPHPEYDYLICLNGQFSETDRQHVEATFSYELPQSGSQEFQPNPLARPDVWSFSTGGAQVPALYYWAGNSIAPLVNSAGDVFENVTATEAEVRATISGNRATFDYALAASVTNCVNQSAYLGGGPYTWMCAGITGQQQTEVVNEQEVRYWTFTTELVYRESTHLLFLPDVGYNYIATSKDDDAATSSGQGSASGDASVSGKTGQSGVTLIQGVTARTAGGTKKRCWVWHDPGNNEPKIKIPSADPKALNQDGSMKADGASPNLLVRRMHRAIDFAQFFGTPVF